MIHEITTFLRNINLGFTLFYFFYLIMGFIIYSIIFLYKKYQHIYCELSVQLSVLPYITEQLVKLDSENFANKARLETIYRDINILLNDEDSIGINGKLDKLNEESHKSIKMCDELRDAYMQLEYQMSRMRSDLDKWNDFKKDVNRWNESKKDWEESIEYFNDITKELKQLKKQLRKDKDNASADK